MRYLIFFSYDGTLFSGYQKQPGLRTIEGEFEKALFNINNHTNTRIFSSGRTDAGVHATYQTAHFDLNIKITLFKLKCALNSLLPKDIHVFSVKNVNSNFHARFMAKQKTYKYMINCDEYDPIKRNYCYQYNRELDIDKMKKAAICFKGIHNFKNFVSNECIKSNYIREITAVNLIEKNGIIELTFTGNGFMKYQIRNMVGILIKVGSAKLPVSVVNELLICDDNKKNIFTAPPEGLYLINVSYDE